MTVRELIAELGTMPQELQVCVWDTEADDWEPVKEVLFEAGHSTVDLLTHLYVGK